MFNWQHISIQPIMMIEHVIHCQVHYEGMDFLSTVVYARNSCMERRSIWSKLVGCKEF